MPPFAVSPSPPLKVLLNPLAWFLWILDFLIWVLTVSGPLKLVFNSGKSEQACEVNHAWRDIDAKYELRSKVELAPFCETVHDLMSRAFSKYANKRACGTRTYLGTHQPPGVKFPLQKFGPTRWITYKEFGRMVNEFGLGLLELGLKPAPEKVDLQETTGPHCILIFEETSQAWALSCLGAFSQSLAVATSYATLGMSSVAEAINETSAAAIVCNIKDVEKLASYCAQKCPTLKTIIYSTNNSLETEPKSSEVLAKFKVISVEGVVQLGSNSLQGEHPPKADHLAVIMYTSGSTGKPKGVMIKHSSMVASIAAMSERFRGLGLEEASETYLAYLPAAHILELIAEVSMFCLGSAIGFADPRTISAKGACRQRGDGTVNTKPEYPDPPGAIQEFQPTVMPAVPKIWDILKKGVEETIGKSSPVMQFLFQVAYTGRFYALQQGREAPLFKALVFKKLKQMIGGNMAICISGGGPISADVQNFISTAFAVPLLQGYALTETTCAGCVQKLGDIRTGIVGPPVASVQIKLRSCITEKGEEEVQDRKKKPYLNTDVEHYGKPCRGRGEILICGPSVSSGYFKQPAKTAEVFKTDEDGKVWFSSGDVGLVTLDGSLMIVDRVKNLIKLKGGEYIAIEAMEKEYGTSAYVNGVNGGIMCYGDGEMDRPVALVQANTAELEKWAKGQSISYSDVGDLCRNPAVVKTVLADLVKAGKAGDLCANEMLCDIALIPGTGAITGDLEVTSPWTPENGGLTASNKLQRKQIEASYDPLIKPLMKAAIR